MEPQLQRHITIGRFAELTGISAKSLRRYDESGLLVPDHVDPDTGYRYYSVAQLDAAAIVHLLRSLDVPLAEIGDLLREDDPERTRELLRRHHERMRARHDEIGRILARVDRLVGEDQGLLPYAMELADYEPVMVVSVRTIERLDAIDETIDAMAAGLRAGLAGHGLTEAGREFSLMHNVMTWYAGADVEVCLPVKVRRAKTAASRGARPGGDAPPAQEPAGGATGSPAGSPSPAHTLPGFTAVCTICTGPWSDLEAAYLALLSWTARHGHEVSGPAREFYRVDHRDTVDPAGYRTELALPVASAPARWSVPDPATP